MEDPLTDAPITPTPIGVVRSGVRARGAMPAGGVPEGRHFAPRLPAVLTPDGIVNQPLKKLGLWYRVDPPDPQD